jgi:type IV secretory pathway TraG/TraD family ATPase VirD4
MGEDLLLAMLLLTFRLLVLPVQLLFRWGIWQGLRFLSFGAFLVVFLGDLHTADWNPVVWVADASHAQVVFLVVLIFLTGGLMITGPAPAKPTTHGSAGWARRGDLQGLLLGRRRSLPPGALALAPYGAFAQLALPPAQAMQHTLVIGPSGSGKTRSVFMPNAAWATGSVLCTDPKAELWMHTSGLHSIAWRFAPREPEASCCCNWIPWCRDPRLANLLAAAAMQTDADHHEQQFWKLSDLQLCAALFAHTAYQAIPTPASAYALLELGPRELMATLAQSPARTARVAARTMGELKAETLAGIVLAVSNKLAFLDDERIARFTSADIRPLDFRLLLERPVAAYWVLHEADVARLAGLSAVFFTLLLDQLTQKRGPVPVTLLLDEFANIGHLPHFPTTITVARGRGLALVLGVQALAQLDALYGHEGADTIRTNCATKVVLHGLDYPSAEQVSRLLGEWTVQQEYTSRKPESLLVTSRSYSEHQTARRLLTADEVRRLGQDELLIVSGNRKPVRTGRWFWDRPPQPARAGASGPTRVQPVALPVEATADASPHRPGASLRDRLRALDEDDEDEAR